MPRGKGSPHPERPGRRCVPTSDSNHWKSQVGTKKGNRKTLASDDRQCHFLTVLITTKMKTTHLPFKVVARIKVINIQINMYLRRYLPKNVNSDYFWLAHIQIYV